MKRIKASAAFLCLLFALCFISAGDTGAAALPAVVRVGLISVYQNAGEISISNGALIFGYGGNGAFDASYTITGSFCAVPSNMYYIKIEGHYNDYNSARREADAYVSGGYKASVCFADTGSFAVCLGGYRTEEAAADDIGSIGKNAVILSPNGRRVVLTANDSPYLIFDNPSRHGMIAGADGAYITIGGRSYRGVIELVRTGGGITPVNTLGTEDYLCGVVASEMLTGAGIEALKAQAVACRSYFMTQRGVHGSAAYDICDAPHCQNYIGTGKETDASVAAVRETAGIMAYYDGAVINATFYSSNGGVTSNSEDVWNNTIPYLRSVVDAYEQTGKVWERSFSLDELTRLLTKNGAGIGNATGMYISESSDAGRVNALVITGENGSHELVKEDIRIFFAPSEDGMLDSRLFTIADAANQNGVVSPGVSAVGFDEHIYRTENITDIYILQPDGGVSSAGISDGLYAAGADGIAAFYADLPGPVAGDAGAAAGDIRIIGRGYGHGVGMSQHGANAMASAGYNFYDILTFYYTGIDVK